MIALVQRVSNCSVQCNGHPTQSIGKGILVFLGIERSDTNKDMKYIVQKLLKLRIFNDEREKMNLSVSDINGDIMLVSQFTLCGDTKKGNRPSFINAMRVELARPIYNEFVNHITNLHSNVKMGVFQGDMQIKLTNDGPVTLTIRS